MKQKKSTGSNNSNDSNKELEYKQRFLEEYLNLSDNENHMKPNNNESNNKESNNNESNNNESNNNESNNKELYFYEYDFYNHPHHQIECEIIAEEIEKKQDYDRNHNIRIYDDIYDFITEIPDKSMETAPTLTIPEPSDNSILDVIKMNSNSTVLQKILILAVYYARYYNEFYYLEGILKNLPEMDDIYGNVKGVLDGFCRFNDKNRNDSMIEEEEEPAKSTHAIEIIEKLPASSTNTVGHMINLTVNKPQNMSSMGSSASSKNNLLPLPPNLVTSPPSSPSSTTSVTSSPLSGLQGTYTWKPSNPNKMNQSDGGYRKTNKSKSNKSTKRRKQKIYRTEKKRVKGKGFSTQRKSK
jgi:hypothetical protein